MHLTFESINRGKTSIGQYCENNGVENWSEYLHFASYRKAENVRGKPVQEIIYPHSKLMIVDDQHVIIGSSNINDRSMMGDRDSEVAICAYDESGEFGKSLRLKIWSVALGIETDDPILDECPSSDAMFNHLMKFLLFYQMKLLMPCQLGKVPSLVKNLPKLTFRLNSYRSLRSVGLLEFH